MATKEATEKSGEDKKKVDWAELAEDDDHGETHHKEDHKVDEAPQRRNVPPRKINDDNDSTRPQKNLLGTGGRGGKKPYRGGQAGSNPRTGPRNPAKNKEERGPPPSYTKPEEKEKKKETFVSKNMFEFNESEGEEDYEEEATLKVEKHKDHALKDLLVVREKPDTKQAQTISKKEKKKKELEELDLILNELGLNPNEEKASAPTQEENKDKDTDEKKENKGEEKTEDEAQKKKKKKKKVKASGEEGTVQAEENPKEETVHNDAEVKAPVDVEKIIAEHINKKKATKEKKKGPNLEDAKQEALARAALAKKKNKKKNFDL